MARIGQGRGQRLHVDPAIGGERNCHGLGETFPPGDLVGVVFVGADENHRVGCMIGQPAKRGPCRRRDGDAEYLLQLVDGAGRPGGTGHQTVVGPGIDRRLDGADRLAHPGIAGAPGGAVLAMGVGIVGVQPGHHRLDIRLGAARRGVVGIEERTCPERGRQTGRAAGEPRPHACDTILDPAFIEHGWTPMAVASE